MIKDVYFAPTVMTTMISGRLLHDKDVRWNQDTDCLNLDGCNAQVGTRTCRNLGQKTTIIADRLLHSHTYLISEPPVTRLRPARDPTLQRPKPPATRPRPDIATTVTTASLSRVTSAWPSMPYSTWYHHNAGMRTHTYRLR